MAWYINLHSTTLARPKIKWRFQLAWFVTNSWYNPKTSKHFHANNKVQFWVNFILNVYNFLNFK